MGIFKEYSKYYDLLYQDKDYQKEVSYVDRLIKLYSYGDKKVLLDVGCGTGQHGRWFKSKGYSVVGIDKSAEMIKIAKSTAGAEKSRLEFYVADSTRFRLSRKFNIAVALFHVMSYQADNDTFLSTLKNVYRLLKNRGLFIFDFWYGPAVLVQRPELKIKKLSDKKNLIKRTAIPRININKNTVDVCYKISIENKVAAFKKKVIEHHIMRYFFLPELYLMLENTGFKPVKCLKWMSLREGVSENSWSGVIVARK